MNYDRDARLRKSLVHQQAGRILACVGIAFAVTITLPSGLAQDVSIRPRGGTPLTIEEGGTRLPQPPMDILALRDTFWNLEQLDGAATNVASTVVRILLITNDGSNGEFTFSTPSYFISIPFHYKEAGMEFFSPDAHGGVAKNPSYPHDQQIGQLLESELHKSRYFELRDEMLTFQDSNHRSTIVLKAAQQKGIENRRWGVARYRGADSNSTHQDELIDVNEAADVVFMNGRVYGSPGCGGWVGTYAVSGDKLSTDVGTVLAGLCSSGQFAQAAWVEKGLKGDRRIEKDGSNILLRDQSSRPMLLLVPF